jgi:hypothetical protein
VPDAEYIPDDAPTDTAPAGDAPEDVVLASAADAPGRNTLDLPMGEVWPPVNRWNDRMEEEYSAFVARLGAAVAARRCGRMDVCLRNPEINSLYDSASDGRLNLDVDCADLPYILRAYFAFKRRLPFGYVSVVAGWGADPRYMLRVRPVQWRAWQQASTPRRFLRDLAGSVHSGMYRVPPTEEAGDLYPTAVTREAIRPGTAYYDPNGHVLVVTEVRQDGSIYLMDGHPDGSMTYKRFGEAFAIGTARLGGGFKNFRPLRWDGAQLTRASNAELPHYDGASQWDPAVWQAGLPADTARGRGGLYHRWVRARMASPDAVQDPVNEVREQARALCNDVTDRVYAVDLALAEGVHRRPHPSSLPWNIYGTTGDWETWSTPSRDARLKAAFQELYDTVAATPEGAARDAMRDAWDQETSRASCRFGYTRTDGARQELTMSEVLDRLWALSFDPYHCPELRWGAPEGTPERASCTDDAGRLRWYAAEARLRNQIERSYGVATPLTLGPETPPMVDVRALFRR